MKKTIYTLNICDYSPDICALTYPLMRAWADKIGAAFHVIRDRKWPDMPPVYEKLQIYDLARERGDDWSIFLDGDTLVYPNMFDPTEFLHRREVFCHMNDMANMRFRSNDIFRRDGRSIGWTNWLAIASSWCRDLWHPLEDMTFSEAVANITTTLEERNKGITPDHLIDDYVLSYNVAKYGLHFKTFPAMLQSLGMDPKAQAFWHNYTFSEEQKVVEMRKVLQSWGMARADELPATTNGRPHQPRESTLCVQS